MHRAESTHAAGLPSGGKAVPALCASALGEPRKVASSLASAIRLSSSELADGPERQARGNAATYAARLLLRHDSRPHPVLAYPRRQTFQSGPTLTLVLQKLYTDLARLPRSLLAAPRTLCCDPGVVLLGCGPKRAMTVGEACGLSARGRS